MSLPVSRRSFLSLATSGLAVSALGLTPAAEAARKRAAAPAAPSVALAAGTVYLNFNEHPTGLSPAALDAASRSLARSGRYLFEMEQDLRNLMAGELQLPHDHLAFFPGSSDPLNRAGTLFTSPRAGLVMADPTFEALADLAAAQGVPVRKVPLRADGAHDVKAMAKADPSAGLIYLCNPNNPTGSITPRAEIEWLLANKPASAVLVVDEAYIHYSTEPSVADLVRQRQDLIVLRTFSKLYGMAGMRLGAALAPPGLLTKLASLGGNPLPVPAMAAGIASLRDPMLVPSRRADNARVRDDTIAWLKSKGYTCLPSQANCFMIDVKRDGKVFADSMQKQGVIVGRSWPIWPKRVRVTVGSEAEMLRFREAFAKAKR
ncbi:pyridoxal phosphate-dependent aminotransferase [Xanthomonas campestris]|uniref:pyridoxal phosphate-dependent aminotransferase n=1 Tax=Xanthomonas campestris TaxID=339 RepID=UPI000E3279D7|nr:pyridoxal phosphate-dependent aminotransferase [Xanthomonas campestris]MCC8485169.1 pyridoxal phosphate-dependent aminotransferase [Xanthomonas campestris]MCF8826925.1 pyridoxal phosphate-dependent aminotransferase [Xanthomonas campestris pv. raphani]MEA9651610.1 pyridoxal phosphate-dependent aminotransferase [Xanthomonas campestris pv. raphani]MEA9744914.1 pyridoxal phosphate-dependent aminotransferase [Xanthomonas campestris pv. raphani]MEA9768585.1 pyridoxal phosphate-dependent aminotran